MRPIVPFAVFLVVVSAAMPVCAQTWHFVDITAAAGAQYDHGYVVNLPISSQGNAGGVAAGDYDNDGWVDLYVVRGDIGPNVLLRNRGDGTFEEVGAEAGVALTGVKSCGPLFADLNGDGWLDLFVGGIQNTTPTYFVNRCDGTFEDATLASGIDIDIDTYSSTAGDYDRDGDMDLLSGHWGGGAACARLWRNEGDGTFTCVDQQAMVRDPFIDLGFTPNFADINNDRWPDILFASDFTRSQVLINDGDGTFTDVTTHPEYDAVISDENGMGGTVGDYDNDGDLDWFVSSIWDESGGGSGWGITGNRLYRNTGSGVFEDATDEAGVREGDWGWGSSFVDLNNDGHLDIFHVNGWTDPSEPFVDNPARMFVSNGDGTFTERGAELGADDRGQGRGIVCFDFDRDGDIDIFIQNVGQNTVLLRNDGGNDLNYLTVKLQGLAPNTEAIGARVYVTAGGETQFRELRAGSNYVSQNPVEAHFGLGLHTVVDTLRIQWPDTAKTVLTNVAVNQLLEVRHPQAPPLWEFVDVTSEAAVAFDHGYVSPLPIPPQAHAAGVAAGDYDKDGWVDLYVVRGDIGPNVLLRNKHDGTFDEVGAAAGVDLTGTMGSGPLFADLNGDGWLDLFVGGIGATTPTLFFGRDDGTFEDVTTASGIDIDANTYSAAAGDYDRDGDLDLFVTHWMALGSCNRLWQNQGDGTFVCVDDEAGVEAGLTEWSFTPNFADINSDGWPDILLAADFGTSKVFLNNQDGTFRDVTSSVISDENGKGAAVGDYDNDGDLDWFVSSIWDPDGLGILWGKTGNRLYRNLGDGSFEDATDEVGVREGDYGRGASFADLNNDGHLDLYMVNGWPFDVADFVEDPARLFVSNGDGTFSERGLALGANYRGQGRGIACFDYDRDGDLDLFVASANEPTLLLRNDNGNVLNWISIQLNGVGANTQAIGARIYVTADGHTQLRELSAGNNFVSQNPVEAHFGVGAATRVDMIRVEWPDTAITLLSNIAVNQVLTIDYPTGPPPTPLYEPRFAEVGPIPSGNQVSMRLELPGGTAAAVRIYDVAGRLVQTLAVQNTGSPVKITWNGRNFNGQRVASGVYLARIESSRGMSQTKRIVIVR